MPGFVEAGRESEGDPGAHYEVFVLPVGYSDKEKGTKANGDEENSSGNPCLDTFTERFRYEEISWGDFAESLQQSAKQIEI